ncbi:hypothetical protein SNEBB_004801 [Seison nebaliae]|nr:hypothetical protein SNEBB_004801 [Seison nebaliae]
MNHSQLKKLIEVHSLTPEKFYDARQSAVSFSDDDGEEKVEATSSQLLQFPNKEERQSINLASSQITYHELLDGEKERKSTRKIQQDVVRLPTLKSLLKENQDLLKEPIRMVTTGYLNENRLCKNLNPKKSIKTPQFQSKSIKLQKLSLSKQILNSQISTSKFQSSESFKKWKSPITDIDIDIDQSYLRRSDLLKIPSKNRVNEEEFGKFLKKIKKEIEHPSCNLVDSWPKYFHQIKTYTNFGNYAGIYGKAIEEIIISYENYLEFLLERTEHKAKEKINKNEIEKLIDVNDDRKYLESTVTKQLERNRLLRNEFRRIKNICKNDPSTVNESWSFSTTSKVKENENDKYIEKFERTLKLVERKGKYKKMNFPETFEAEKIHSVNVDRLKIEKEIAELKEYQKSKLTSKEVIDELEKCVGMNEKERFVLDKSLKKHKNDIVSEEKEIEKFLTSLNFSFSCDKKSETISKFVDKFLFEDEKRHKTPTLPSANQSQIIKEYDEYFS